MDDYEDRVRERAYHLWQEEGSPPGRERDHWEKARELVAIEDNLKYTTIPVNKSRQNIGPTGEPVEPIIAAENVGDLPTLTDQGEEQPVPKRRNAEGAPAEKTMESPRSRASKTR